MGIFAGHIEDFRSDKNISPRLRETIDSNNALLGSLSMRYARFSHSSIPAPITTLRRIEPRASGLSFLIILAIELRIIGSTVHSRSLDSVCWSLMGRLGISYL
jgi:hypothetical protein